MHPLFKTLHVIERLGHIEQCMGLKLIAQGPPKTCIGELCDILDHQNQKVTQAEVIGFHQDKVHLMLYEPIPMVMGYTVRATGSCLLVPVGDELLGHALDAFGKPLQKRITVSHQRRTSPKKTNPLNRMPITERLNTGIHAIDALLPIGKGQRIGLFAGSGVGKSTLLANIAKNASADVMVIALIGERGREVNDFMKYCFDEATLKKAVIIVSCSDEPALMRRQAALTATTIAEYFCEQGKAVLLLMDSITRLAMAQREIGLNLGEPPTARGYTPSVFSLLPGLVERAGHFTHGSISAIYTVLVEGDDLNEPIADTMRSLLDGHLVLTRELAQKRHFPAISITQSLSRLTPQLVSEEEGELIHQVIGTFSLYEQHKALIELGVYKPGTQPKLDQALSCIDRLNTLLTQNPPCKTAHLLQQLKEIMA